MGVFVCVYACAHMCARMCVYIYTQVHKINLKKKDISLTQDFDLNIRQAVTGYNKAGN